jgi:hypothetical protein
MKRLRRIVVTTEFTGIQTGPRIENHHTATSFCQGVVAAQTRSISKARVHIVLELKSRRRSFTQRKFSEASTRKFKTDILLAHPAVSTWDFNREVAASSILLIRTKRYFWTSSCWLRATIEITSIRSSFSSTRRISANFYKIVKSLGSISWCWTIHQSWRAPYSRVRWGWTLLIHNFKLDVWDHIRCRMTSMNRPWPAE